MYHPDKVKVSSSSLDMSTKFIIMELPQEKKKKKQELLDIGLSSEQIDRAWKATMEKRKLKKEKVGNA